MSAFAWLATIIAASFVWIGLQQNKKRLALPPGPKALPIIGNLRDMALTGLWFEARKWAKAHGQSLTFLSARASTSRSDLRPWHSVMHELTPVVRFPCAGELVYLNIFGQGILFVNTYEAAVDLLEKRGAIYSDKPKMVMAGEL